MKEDVRLTVSSQRWETVQQALYVIVSRLKKYVENVSEILPNARGGGFHSYLNLSFEPSQPEDPLLPYVEVKQQVVKASKVLPKSMKRGGR